MKIWGYPVYGPSKCWRAVREGAGKEKQEERRASAGCTRVRAIDTASKGLLPSVSVWAQGGRSSADVQQLIRL